MHVIYGHVNDAAFIVESLRKRIVVTTHVGQLRQRKKLAFQWIQLIAKSIHICQDLSSSSSSSSSCSHVSISGHRAAKRSRIFILSTIRFPESHKIGKWIQIYSKWRERWLPLLLFATIFLYRYWTEPLTNGDDSNESIIVSFLFVAMIYMSFRTIRSEDIRFDFTSIANYGETPKGHLIKAGHF